LSQGHRDGKKRESQHNIIKKLFATMNEVKMEKSTGSPAEAAHPKRGGFKPKARTAAFQQPKFEGRCDGLKGFTFDCNDSRQTTGLNTSIKELAEYVGRTYTYGGDIR
jgi:hypothetical protein